MRVLKGCSVCASGQSQEHTANSKLNKQHDKVTHFLQSFRQCPFRHQTPIASKEKQKNIQSYQKNKKTNSMS